MPAAAAAAAAANANALFLQRCACCYSREAFLGYGLEKKTKNFEWLWRYTACFFSVYV